MKHKKLLVIGLVLAGYAGLEAKHYKASSERAFNRLVDKNELVAVMFYHDSKDSRDQLSDFKSASRGDKYVTYISVNLDDRDLGSLADVYKVGTTPTFLLIRNGRTYSEKGKRIVMTGMQSPSAIRNFVRDYFHDYIEDIRERKREEADYNRPSVSFGVGYGYPYYGGYGYPYYGGYWGYPYYSRPGFSFGVGF